MINNHNHEEVSMESNINSSGGYLLILLQLDNNMDEVRQSHLYTVSDVSMNHFVVQVEKYLWMFNLVLI